jgi:hypothetical protein
MALPLQGYEGVRVNMKIGTTKTVSIAPYPQMKCSIENKKARMGSIHN